MYVPARTRTLEGQEFLYNEQTKTVVLEITQPFYKAGILLKWERGFGVPGLGINKSIIKFVEQTKTKLLVRVLSNPTNNEFWINYDRLRDFIKNHKSEYPVSGKIIHVIPWGLFTSKPTFTGAKRS